MSAALLAAGLAGTLRAVSVGDQGLRQVQEVRWGGLLAAAQSGDARAYDTLLREVTPRLRQLCRARIRDLAEVEDAVQDALMTIHALRHTYDPARPFGPWMTTIATRRAIDRLRRRGRTSGRESNLDDLPEGMASVAPVAEERIGARNLRDAVSDLPESQRTALRLAKLEDLSLAEASKRSGLSVGALKVATHRAMRSLRRRFGVDEGDDRADR
jgi:RNA polymerase sigma-70 factor (ECF subfamily)